VRFVEVPGVSLLHLNPQIVVESTQLPDLSIAAQPADCWWRRTARAPPATYPA
jgi:hypothetical protein